MNLFGFRKKIRDFHTFLKSGPVKFGKKEFGPSKLLKFDARTGCHFKWVKTI